MFYIDNLDYPQFSGSSRNVVDRRGRWIGKEVELAAEGGDLGAVAFEAAEAAGVGLDGLDLGVEAFGQGIGEWVSEIGQQMSQVGLERARDRTSLHQVCCA